VSIFSLLACCNVISLILSFTGQWIGASNHVSGSSLCMQSNPTLASVYNTQEAWFVLPATNAQNKKMAGPAMPWMLQYTLLAVWSLRHG